MTARVARHLRDQFAGYIALALVLAGGTAYATHPGGKNSIGSRHIVNGQVKAADLGTGSIRSSEVAADAVGSSELASGAISGSDIDEAGLELGAEPWNEVGDGDGPAFASDASCAWKNTGGPHNTAGFMRDQFGVVHLKGRVDADDVSGCDLSTADRAIFNLPAGYRPAGRRVIAALSNSNLAEVNVDGPAIDLGAGAVSVDAGTAAANAKAWVSLDGITFRCMPSGVAGCP